jgi:hypothetical protein
MQRKAIALIAAIFVMIAVSILGILFLSSSTQGVKRTGDQYLYNQATLLAKSAEEYTVLAVQGHDRSAGNCLDKVNITYPKESQSMFEINVTVHYVGFGGLGCNNYILNVASEDLNGSMLLDITVTSSDGISTEPIRYHRRSLQKL